MHKWHFINISGGEGGINFIDPFRKGSSKEMLSPRYTLLVSFFVSRFYELGLVTLETKMPSAQGGQHFFAERVGLKGMENRPPIACRAQTVK